MQFSTPAIIALQAVAVIAAPTGDYADLAKDSIKIKSVATYKRGENVRDYEQADLAKDSIKIKSVATYKRGEEYADLAKDSIKIKSVATYKRDEE
ncbi:hypothetical protein CMUS01_16327 [Colletotrichum musicola]|uniref:Uncharacterized protein n=1 Tax=Colletotrichum musicola TaxID=2175873 RepID=A0A8H6MIM7_9PEZI|nr:hypothetical protein CMUS01_16327 [Colletotrichum musicola]